MKKLGTLTIIVLIFLSHPFSNFTYAQDIESDSIVKEVLLLSQLERNTLFGLIQRELTNSDFYLWSVEKQAALFSVRAALRDKNISFLPGFITTEAVKVVLNTTSLIKKISEQTIKTILTELENKSVEMAVNYVTNWLFQNNIRRASGDLQDEMQYIIVTDSPMNGKGQLVLEVFSSNHIDPPSGGASWGYTNPYPGLPKGEKLHPFVLKFDIDISIGKNIEFLSAPSIDISFPDKVPRLELAKELPYPIEEQKINLLNKLTAIKKVLDALGGAGIEFANTLGKGVGVVKDITEEFFSFVSQIVALGGAGLVDPFQEESQGFDAIQVKLNQLKEQLALQEQNLAQDKDKEGEAKSVENLISLSFPQDEVILGETKDETEQIIKQELNPIRDEVEAEQILNPIKDDSKDKDDGQEQMQELVFAGCANGQINVNVADNELLQEIVQIGAVRAQKIMEARAAAPFYSIQELDQISGIAQGIVGQIEEQGLACASYAQDASFQPFQKPVVFSGGGGGGGGGASSPQTSAGPAVCSKDNLGSPIHTPIVINEVAWMGTANSANDEWIELKNVSGAEVSLDGWQLLDKDEQIAVIFEADDVILAGSFYLLERTDDTTVPEIAADRTYTGALGNTNETLRLFDADCGFIDEVAADPDWPAGDNTEKQSMERTTELVWVTYSGVVENGILGTPKAENNYEEPAPADTTPPQVEFAALASLQENTVFDLSWEAEDVLGAVTPSGLDAFSLLYTVSPSQDGIFLQYHNGDDWTDWEQDAAGALQLDSATETVSVSGKDGFSYFFSITAKDKAGNESEEDTAETRVELVMTVVINEIAWMGTAADANDEWVELYNRGADSIDLTGWKLAADDGVPEIDLIGTIPANGYFLVERSSDDNTISDIIADLAVPFSGAGGGSGLSNSGETIRLIDAEGTLIDLVDASAGWQAGDNTIKKTMERIDSAKVGSDPTNWANNNLITHNGKDAANGNINGTPGQQNSVSYSSTTVINTAFLRLDEFDKVTLAFLGSPYEMLGNIEVPLGKTLIVEPGVTIRLKSQKSHVIIHGTLEAVGSKDQVITFTDGAGGNFGNWCGFSFFPTSTNSQLEYVEIEQSASVTPTCGTLGGKPYALLVDGTDVTIKNSGISGGNTDNKLSLRNSDSIVDSLTVTGDTTKTAFSAGVLIEGGNPTITNSAVQDSSIGIFVQNNVNDPASLSTITHNILTDNTYAIALAGSSGADAVLSGNTASGNTYNGIWVRDAIPPAGAVWEADNIPYIVHDLDIAEGRTLTIQPGVVVKFVYTPLLPLSATELIVRGTLKVQGTSDLPITFTAIADESVAAGALGAGGVSTAAWKRIHFLPTSAGSVLSHTVVKYGGNKAGDGALRVEGELDLQNVTIQDSPNVGIYSSGTLTGSNITLADNAYAFHLAGEGCPILTGVVISGDGKEFYSNPLECAFE